MNNPKSDELPGELPHELPHEIRQQITRHQAPPALRRRIHFMLDQHPAAPAAPRGAGNWLRMWSGSGSWPAPRLWLGQWLGQWLGIGASFACGALLAVGVVRYQASDQAHENFTQQFEQQLVASHVRSLMAAHKTDVASSDQHTVKPWFVGKLDYAPVVIDLAREGFPLLGGRLDYVDGRAIAALVYARSGHVINLFVRPEGDARAPRTGQYTRQGYNLSGWNQSSMQFWAVTDASADELSQFMGAMKLASALKN